MREIKFRAWDSHNKVMFDWDYLKTWTFKEIESQKSLVRVMQFTGLRDTTGKEIYEGDIIPLWTIPDNPEDYENGKSKLRHVVVEWSEGMYNICESHWCTFIPRYSHVIGNKYENPELCGKD